MAENQSNKKIMASNIKHYMETNDIRATDLCQALGFSMSTFSDWINAKSYPRIDKIEAMANFFGIQKSDLIEDKSDQDVISKIGGVPYHPTHRVPILGYISAGLPLYAEEHIEGYTYTDLNGGNEYFALRVKGDSMNAARIYDGDLLMVRKQSMVENGNIAVVMVDGENATVKRFYKDGNQVTLMPQSTNPVHLPQVYDVQKIKIEIIGKVVENKINIE